jgi:hypothetical protein
MKGLRVALALAIIPVALGAGAASAGGFELPPGSTTFEILDAAGQPDSRAGAHPDRLIQAFTIDQSAGATEDPQDVTIDLPAGFGAELAAVPACSRQDYDSLIENFFCGAKSQVGWLHLPGGEVTELFSIEPGPNEPASFGTGYPRTKISTRLRSVDFGLSMLLRSLPQGLSAGTLEVELWGVPADHQQETSIPRLPLLTTPTHCDGPPPAATVITHSWQHPDRWISGIGDTGHGLVGCAALPFAPSLAISLGSAGVDVPTGANIDLTVPQSVDPDDRATSQVEGADIRLPEGMTISPGGAVGLVACADSQLQVGSSADPSCPSAARIGAVELDVAGVGKPLSGAIYLGQERPGDRFRLFAVANGPGTTVKFVASLRPDPVTGRLTARLQDLPQTSFSHLSLRLEGGRDALLATPLGCGPAPTSATVRPYSGTAPVAWTSSVSIGGRGCAAPAFSPGFVGGATDTRAGHATAFTATVRRADGQQLPEHLTLELPVGMSAAVGRIDPCSPATIPSGACPEASRLGSAVAELGPGPNPARLRGAVFFTGPYKRAPFGLVLAFPAKIGPFDLGTLVVRGALRVDTQTGQVTAKMDSLPTVFEGMAIRFQTIALDLDRPGFLHNPTACGSSVVEASLASVAGTTALLSTPFAVQGCVGLPFRPDFSMTLSGDELRKEGRPDLAVAAKVPTGNANIRSAAISFPRILRLDAAKVEAICARGRAADDRCPKGSRVGSGFARTPLLKQPMKGSIFLVQPRGGGSPELWTSLAGEGLQVTLKAQTASGKGGTEAKLVDMPDFPLKSFAIHLDGGEHGLFKLKRNPCGAGRGLLAPVDVAGHNGALKSIHERAEVRGRCTRGG